MVDINVVELKKAFISVLYPENVPEDCKITKEEIQIFVNSLSVNQILNLKAILGVPDAMIGTTYQKECAKTLINIAIVKDTLKS